MNAERRKELDELVVRVPQHLSDFGYLQLNGRDLAAWAGLDVGRRKRPPTTVPAGLVAGGKSALHDVFIEGPGDGSLIHLLLCACGEPGCWSLSVTFHRTRRFVYWRLEGGREFVFGRKLYEAAFARAVSCP